MARKSALIALGTMLLIASGQTIAAQAAAAPSGANAPAASSKPLAPGSTQADKPGSPKKTLTPPPGKLRGLTNEMRWAAAARNTDRKMHARATVHAPIVHKGVSK